jgi:plastocyanin
MRKFTALFAVTALVAAIAAASAFAATNVAWKVGTNKTIRIHKGGKVKWVWSDRQPHNVKGRGFHSKLIARKGFSFSHTFRSKGTFRIICQVHSNMHTTVKVS